MNFLKRLFEKKSKLETSDNESFFDTNKDNLLKQIERLENGKK